MNTITIKSEVRFKRYVLLRGGEVSKSLPRFGDISSGD